MLEKLEEFAFGVIRLTPFDFYRMTFREFKNLQQGFTAREHEERKFRAYLTCVLANSSGNFKEPLKVSDILPEIEDRGKDKVLSQEDRDELFKVIKGRRIK